MPSKSMIILDTLSDAVPALFDQAQSSLANHRKNCVALHKLHTQAAAITRYAKNGTREKLVGEKTFGDIFIDMLSRVLVVKKGTQAADRVVRFVGEYIKFSLDKVATTSDLPEEEDESPASRFALRLVKWLLQGFVAKDKTVRYRSVSLVEVLLSHLGQLDEDTYSSLRAALTERIRDKEPYIRAHAVAALSKLMGAEDASELQDGESSILESLLDSMCYDPAADVRRAALLHIPLTPSTLPTLLTRTRDADPLIRKLVFTLLRPPVPSASPAKKAPAGTSVPPLTHPRELTLEQRERAVRDGLGDREDGVRVAAGRMVGAWFDVVCAEAGEGVVRGLEGFLKLFDAVVPDGLGVAEDALRCLFVTRSDVLDGMNLDAQFWDDITPESALIARIFHAYCLDNNGEAQMEAANIPVVTAMAFHIQTACNNLLDAIEELEDAGLRGELAGSAEDHKDKSLGKLEESIIERAFIVAELLRLAARRDYSDEIGRRKVFAVVREMLAHDFLPESLIEPCMDVLRETAPDERELIRIVVEIVSTLRDDGESNDIEGTQTQSLAGGSLETTHSTVRSVSLRRTKQPHEMTPEEHDRADMIDIRCLAICTAMLSRVNGDFDENSTLEGVLTDLILPAVKRREMALRERGLVSLGLCCLIAKNMAMSSFQLFLNQVQSAPEELKIKVLQVVFDMLMVYEQELLRRSDRLAENIIAFLLQTLELEDSQVVQALLCVGISKLMLNGLITDKRVLAALVLAYVSPATAENQELRQCLAYFLPAYCYSSAANQDRMRSIFLTTYSLVTDVHAELEDGQEMISPHQFGVLFTDWTDPQMAVRTEAPGDRSMDVHVNLAIDILVAVYSAETSADDKKTLSQLLGKLYLPTGPEPLNLLILSTLLSNLPDETLEDASLQKVLVRFKARFIKQYGKQLEKLDVQTLVQEPRFREICMSAGLGPDSDEEAAPGRAAVGSGQSVSAVMPLSASKRTRSASLSSDGNGTSQESAPEGSAHDDGSHTRSSDSVKKRRTLASAAHFSWRADKENTPSTATSQSARSGASRDGQRWRRAGST